MSSLLNPSSTRLSCSKLSSLRLARSKSSHSSPFSHPESTTFITSATTLEQLPKLNGLPEIVVIGRANVGKSSFLNAVLGRRDIAHTSKKAGHTRALNFYQVGVADKPQMVVVDAPGYGSRGRPEWGNLFNSYVESREELRRIYILINAKHGVKESDQGMLSHLHNACLASYTRGTPLTLQAVITKADTLTADAIPIAISGIRRDIFEAAPTCLPPLITSCTMTPPFGIDEARVNMAQSCGLGKT